MEKAKWPQNGLVHAQAYWWREAERSTSRAPQNAKPTKIGITPRFLPTRRLWEKQVLAKAYSSEIVRLSEARYAAGEVE
jgi:hypothetical protein